VSIRTATAPLSDALTEAALPALNRLRVLALGDREEWFRYGGSVRKPAGSQVVAVASRWRLLHRDEILPWVQGVADAVDGAGYFDLTRLLRPAEMPRLVTLVQAAAMLEVSTETVRYYVDKAATGVPPRKYPRFGGGGRTEASERLYPLYVCPRRGSGDGRRSPSWQTLLFADQILTQTGQGDPATWAAIRTMLPIRRQAKDLDGYPGAAASPRPLPVPTVGDLLVRRAKALMIGEQAGWFRYAGADSGHTYRIELTYERGTVVRELAATDVLPWLLGVADIQDKPELVAYRDGLG